MSTLKVSASQVNKVRQCLRMYAFEYVEKLRPPPSAKMQFGTDVHGHLEDWISKSKLPPDIPSGRMAKMAITKEVIPPPDQGLLVENNFVFAWDKNIDVGGFVDLTVPPSEADPIPTVIDYKTTSDLRWAKSPLQLKEDPQAVLYAIDSMLRYDAPEVRIKWIYLISTAPASGNRKPTGVKPSVLRFDAHSKEFQDTVVRLDQDIQEILRIRSLNIKGLSLPPSPESCEMYGGCFHKGRCNLSSGDVLAAHMTKESLKHNKIS